MGVEEDRFGGLGDGEVDGDVALVGPWRGELEGGEGDGVVGWFDAVEGEGG